MVSRSINVIVADDHPIVIAGVTKALEHHPDCKIIATVQSVNEMFSALKKDHCDVLVCDFSFDSDTEPDGLLMLEKIVRLFPDVRIVVLSQYNDLSRVKRIMMSGSVGFVSKASGIPVLPFAIDEVLRGAKYVDPETAKLLIGHMFGGMRDNATEPLTVREMEIMRLYIRGMSVTEIARHTKRSMKTISAQKQSAMKKLGVRNDVELIGAFKHIDTNN
jgi:two-component system, NarL family, captular synthesis response regulator RcsB